MQQHTAKILGQSLELGGREVRRSQLFGARHGWIGAHARVDTREPAPSWCTSTQENVGKHWVQVTPLKCFKPGLFPDTPNAGTHASVSSKSSWIVVFCPLKSKEFDDTDGSAGSWPGVTHRKTEQLE